MKRWIWILWALFPAASAAAEAAGAEAPKPAPSIFAVPGEYLLIAAIVALAFAFIVVGIMRAKLKTASKQLYANQYIREGSFDLTVRQDRFLYETVQRRRIEAQKSESTSRKG